MYLEEPYLFLGKWICNFHQHWLKEWNNTGMMVEHYIKWRVILAHDKTQNVVEDPAKCFIMEVAQSLKSLEKTQCPSTFCLETMFRSTKARFPSKILYQWCLSNQWFKRGLRLKNDSKSEGYFLLWMTDSTNCVCLCMPQHGSVLYSVGCTFTSNNASFGGAIYVLVRLENLWHGTSNEWLWTQNWFVL